MTTFTRARRARSQQTAPPRFSVDVHRRINNAVLASVIAIVFVAAFMARVAWLF